MAHDPITTQNGRYVSTKWALGGTVALLVMAVAGWASSLRATVSSDHDTLIRVGQSLESLDAHMLDIQSTLEVIVEDHQAFRARLQTEGR